MLSRKRLALVAACAAMACTGLVRASDTTTPPAQSPLSLSYPAYAAAAAPRKPLMGLLDKAGLAKPLDDAGINIGGFVEGSWTYNFSTPDNQTNTGRVFDFEDQDPTLNQVDLFIQKSVSASKDKFDVGGMMEWIWGGDARLIHANGVFDHYGFPLFAGSPGTGDGPDEQFDPVQAFIQVNIPVGNGLLVTGGKFVTLLGYETINPTTNPLFSHSFLFGFAIPFTNTGVMAKYAISDNWSVTGAVIRGWDQSLEDNNDAVSFMGQVAYTSDKFGFIANFITGPEQLDNGSKYRTVIDLIATYTVSDQLSLAGNFDYGWEANAADDGGTATWCGLAAYATYKISDMFALQGRVEYFSDSDGARGFNSTLYEATLGVNIKPMPNDPYGSGLVLRPEIRWDGASDDIYNGGTDKSQFTFGIDAIYAF